MGDTPSVVTTVAEPMLEPGRELHGLYRIVGPMGRHGGMGALYKAENKSLKGLFHAVKVQRVRDLTVHALFEREAETLCKLQHPSVVSVQAYGKELEHPSNPESLFQFIVMEYLVGETLDEVIQRRGQLSPHEAVTIGMRIADALKVIHDAGIVHRDLKPANVMLKWTSEQTRVVDWLKLIDLGLALSGAEQGQMAMGTPEYIAPEQAQNHPATFASDLYSLGVILFQLIAGQLPYRMPTEGEPIERVKAILRMHISAPVPHLHELVPEVPNELDELVFRLMQKQVGDRPESASVVTRELQRISHQLREASTQLRKNPLFTSATASAVTQQIPWGVTAPTTDQALEAMKPAARRRRMALVALLVLLLFGAGMLVRRLSGQGAGTPAPVVAVEPVAVPQVPVTAEVAPSAATAPDETVREELPTLPVHAEVARPHSKPLLSVKLTPGAGEVQIRKSACVPDDRWRNESKRFLQEIQTNAASADRARFQEFQVAEKDIYGAISQASTGEQCEDVSARIKQLASRFKP